MESEEGVPSRTLVDKVLEFFFRMETPDLARVRAAVSLFKEIVQAHGLRKVWRSQKAERRVRVTGTVAAAAAQRLTRGMQRGTGQGTTGSA